MLSTVVVLLMGAAIVAGFAFGDLQADATALWALTWGRVTLIDLYLGLVLFAGWVAMREESKIVVLAWWAGLVVLGNLAAAAYVLFAALRASGVKELMLGARDSG